MEKKTCTKCKEVKLIHDFTKDRARKNGLYAWCKPCTRKRNVEYRSKNRTKNDPGVSIKTHIGDKTCSKCREVKTVDNFHKNRSTKDGLSPICKLCKCQVDNKRNAVSNELRKKTGDHKSDAHIKVRNAIRSGKLRPQPCIVCGEKAEAHHSDYSKPLDVDWLCRKHHALWHRYLIPYNN